MKKMIRCGRFRWNPWKRPRCRRDGRGWYLHTCSDAQVWWESRRSRGLWDRM